jgi:hypothetical protein
MDWLAKLSAHLPGGRSFVCSINSKDLLFHRTGHKCPYLAHILKRNRRYFRNRKKAQEKGLRLCNICKQKINQKTLKEYT